MSALSDALRQANTRGLSSRAIAVEAERRGHRINYSTVAGYLNGSHGDPEEATLQALAAALQVPLSRLREAAGLPRDEGPFELPPEAARLNRRQRDAVLSVVGAFLESNVDHREEVTGNAQHPAPTSTDHVEDVEVEDVSSRASDVEPDPERRPGRRA